MLDLFGKLMLKPSFGVYIVFKCHLHSFTYYVVYMEYRVNINV